MNRRLFLRGAGGAVFALPFLESLAPRVARAATSVAPKRLVVFHHPQGVVMSDWAPQGTETNFTLPRILAPLVPHQDRIVVIAGLDNRVPRLNSAGDGHSNADQSLFTCQPFQDQSAAVLVAGGPSFEQVLADRISVSNPYKRLDFGIGGTPWTYGIVNSAWFWGAAGDPIAFTNDPRRAFDQLFADSTLSDADLARRAARRGSVLDAVLEQFDGLRARLPASDVARLDAHAEKVRALEVRLTSGSALACSPPELSFSADYDFGFDDDETAPAQLDLLVSALSCDQTRVATVSFLSGHDPTFPWLATSGGGPVVPTDRYDNWHAMIHDGREEEGLKVGFTWYAETFAALLDRMANTVDIDGDNLLDTTTIVWASEFGNGSGHNTNKIPFVLAGNVGPLGGGRFLDHLVGGPNGDWDDSDHHTGELYTAILQLFGGTDSSFGVSDPSVPPGVLPGILS